MIDKQTVFEIHRLKNLGLSKREIAKKLKLNRKTIYLYLNKSAFVHVRKKRAKGLDPYNSNRGYC